MRITERDRCLLSFIAAHRFVLSGHAQALLGVSSAAAGSRLRVLTAAALLVRTPLVNRQYAYSITRRGLSAIESSLPVPKLKLHSYHHDLGVAWIWLAAREGIWGPVEQILSEREMRSHDASSERGDGVMSIRVGGVGPGGVERLHFPDLVLVTPDRQKVAVELELSGKPRTRRERILGGYAAHRQVDVVLYLVQSPQLARAIATSAAKCGITDRVVVQPVRWPGERSRLELPGPTGP